MQAVPDGQEHQCGHMGQSLVSQELQTLENMPGKKKRERQKKKIENQSLNQLTSHLTSHHWSTSLFVQTSPFTARRPEVCYSSLMLSLFSAVFVDYWLSLIYLNSITQVHHSIAGYSATW